MSLRKFAPCEYADKVLDILTTADIPGMDPWDGLTRHVIREAIARAYAADSNHEELIIDPPHRANWRLHFAAGRALLRAHHLSDDRRREARPVEDRVNQALVGLASGPRR